VKLIELRETSGKTVRPSASSGKAPPNRHQPTADLIKAARRMGLSERRAVAFARGRAGMREAITNVGGLTSRCYAWVPDENDPTTWQLQIARSDDPAEDLVFDSGLVQAAVQLVPGLGAFGRTLAIPDSALPQVKATLRTAWIQSGLDPNEMPSGLLEAALETALRRMGMSQRAAAAAARGPRGGNR
jgi:hypothetical protein